MKKYFIAIGSILLLVLLGFGYMAFASTPADPQAEGKRLLTLSDKYLKQSEDAYCQNIGNLYKDCFDKKTGACQSLNNAEEQFSLDFSSGFQDACGTHEAAPAPVAQSSASSAQPVDPLFRGDEEGNQ